MALTIAPKVPGIAKAFTPTKIKQKINNNKNTSQTKAVINLSFVIPKFSKAKKVF
jgi:hypothetical protein